jgi:hypothetical protein
LPELPARNAFTSDEFAFIKKILLADQTENEASLKSLKRYGQVLDKFP